MKKIFTILLFTVVCTYGQSGSDYFPSSPGYRWFVKNTPLDSLNNPVDSMITFRVDSFAAVTDFIGKTSYLVVSKFGTPDYILEGPYLDSSYVHTESSNIWNYFNGLDAGVISFDFEGWYSVYRLASSTSTTYMIFTQDTLINIDSVNYTMRIEVTGRRLTDEIVSTPFGELNCKKFILKPTVKIIPPILPIPITLVTLNDTVWLAPQHYIVKSNRPSANVNLSLFGFPSFFIPGQRIEVIAPPPVLSLNTFNYNISADGDTIPVIVSNAGQGTLNWNAEILMGGDWISFLSPASGTQGDTLILAFAQNDSLSKRYGTVNISAEGAFSSPRFITIIQEGKFVSYSETENFPGDYSLEQNYPNPFNPETKIDFTLKTAGNARLEVFDVLGNKVAVIAEGYFSAGRHSIKYIPAGIVSGIYIYTLRTSEFTSSRKMILMK